MKHKTLLAMLTVMGLSIILIFATSVHAYPPGSGTCNNCHVYIGYAACNQCHNDPQYVPTIDDSDSPDISSYPEDMGHNDPESGQFTQNTGIWAETRENNRNYVYIMPSANNIRPTIGEGLLNITSGEYEVGNQRNVTIFYTQTQFIMNSTHMIARFRVMDWVRDDVGDTDKFAICWNINASGAVTDFIGGTSGFGKMDTEDGTIDMWFWDKADVAPNGTGMAKDMYLYDCEADFACYKADSDQDVAVGVHSGKVLENPRSEKYFGYWIYFARELTTDDLNDVQFTEGKVINYAIAYWNGSSSLDHYSSWDHTIVLGDSLVYTSVYTSVFTHEVNVTKYTTITETAPGFDVILVVGTLGFVAVLPIIINWKRKKL